MKRIPISLKSFLNEVIGRLPLTGDERGSLGRIQEERDPTRVMKLARDLIRDLVERGALIALEREQADSEERWVLKDPRRRVRARISLPTPRKVADLETIPLPLEAETRTGLRYAQVQELLALQGNLISVDRVTSPRELAHQMEQMLLDLIPVESARFHAISMPTDDAWPPVEWDGLPRTREELEQLAQDRNRMIHWPRLQDGGCQLLLGIGDDDLGWRGLLELRHGEAEYFSRERMALCVLVAGHFCSLLATVLRLQGLIFYDFLTGIYNRAFFEEQAEREVLLARRRSEPMALLIGDIDDFKAFNTRFGYDGGDRALATVACVLKSALRGTDTLARYGGEEFAIILAPPTSPEEANQIGERLREAVEKEPFEITDLEGRSTRQRITLSIGGALFPEHGTSPQELWKFANRHLLKAKADGKNQIRFEPSLPGSGTPSPG